VTVHRAPPNEELKPTAPPRFYLWAALMAVSLWGCGGPAEEFPRPATDSGVVSTVDAAVVAALDSCGQDGSVASRWSGGVRPFRRFALFIPESARIISVDSGTGQLAVWWPTCPDHCRFNVSVYSDSGISLEARIAQMTAEQRRIDSVNQDSATDVGEFDELDAPPRPFRNSNAEGYLVNHSCGDCAATTLRFGHSGLIADVSISADAVPGAGQRMCEMMVIAKSFAWRP
jgi:hypothetical protein